MDDDRLYSTGANQGQEPLKRWAAEVAPDQPWSSNRSSRTTSPFDFANAAQISRWTSQDCQIAPRLGGLASMDRAHRESAPIDLRQT